MEIEAIETTRRNVTVDVSVNRMYSAMKKHLRYFSHHDSAGLWFYNDGKTSITRDYTVLFDPKKCKVVV